MDSDYKPSENDVKTVMEAHGLLPEGPLLDEALGLASLYADRIRQLLRELPDSVDRGKAVLAVIEEGLMQEGFIPNRQEKKFEMAIIEEGLMREGIIPKSHEKRFELSAEKDKSHKDK
ncbi:MAG TPA: hypothetical protein DCP92_16005 [Nitrospiraceae bacterium]|jgi:hypothetical protein|nr:hypothetical protein [Nitrospiraceae bacterium]